MRQKQLGKDIDHCINLYHGKNVKTTGDLSGPHKHNLLAYFADERNHGSVLPESIQVPVRASSYGKYYRGIVDQIRQYDGELWAFDVKYSRMDTEPLIQTYLPCLIAYAAGLGVNVGGLINVRNYGRNDRPVFIYCEVKSPTIELATISRYLGVAADEKV